MANREFAIYRSGWNAQKTQCEVRVLARAEGYAMVRNKKCMPFCVREKELEPITRRAPEAGEQT